MIGKLAVGVVLVAGGLSLAIPSQAAAPSAACDAYVYKGTTVSLCDDFPGSTDRDCGPKGAIKHPVTLIDKAEDPWRLDGDNDGTGCDKGAGQTPWTPPVQPTTTKPTHKPTHHTTSPTPKTSRSTAHNAVGVQTSDTASADHLAITGPSTGTLVGVAGCIVAAGVGAFIAARRRRRKFQA